MIQAPLVTQKAIIREMDAEELKDYIGQLAEVEDHSGRMGELVAECRKQYRQITGIELTPDTPGLNLMTACILAGMKQDDSALNHERYDFE